jgi:hypothetical protein
LILNFPIGAHDVPLDRESGIDALLCIEDKDDWEGNLWGMTGFPVAVCAGTDALLGGLAGLTEKI